ncbi:MAG: winged helix-turn-helix domain-containing protein [Lentisphaeria bacterium]|nr:winged helix-turn-helix domain-containing protein [Lentisphaeria bacterium]
MGRKVVFSKVEIAEAQHMVGGATDVRQLRDGLAVVLSVDLKLTNRQVADVLHASPATVVRMHGRVREQAKGGVAETGKKSTWGGRRRAYMTPEEESDFLRPWEEQAASGGILVVPPIHVAFERRVGRRVQPATVYRLLARHGWRKVAPDNIHPKGNPEVQEEFKKGGSPTRWVKR